MVRRSTVFKYSSNKSKIETDDITSRNFGAISPLNHFDFSFHNILYMSDYLFHSVLSHEV